MVYSAGFWEWVFAFLILSTAILFAHIFQRLKVAQDQQYRYFTRAFILKLTGCVIYYFIYIHYYGSGDTIAYFSGTVAYADLFYADPVDFFRVYFSKFDEESLHIFNQHGIRPYVKYFEDANTSAVLKWSAPLTIITSKSYLLTTILLNVVLFFPVWRLFKGFNERYPNTKWNFISIFLVPSIVFWGGGISKDIYMFSGTCLVVSLLLNSGRKRGLDKMKFWALISIGLYVIIMVKPYVVIALFPAVLLWKSIGIIRKRTQNVLIRGMILPFMLVLSIGIAYSFLLLLGESMDKYAVDKAIDTAYVTQADLKEDYYEGQSFDIGDFEPSLSGVISKVPIASFAGLFFPLPGQVNSLVSNLSALEGIIFLAFFIYVIFMQIKHKRKYKKDDFYIFCFIFCFIFAFMIGLTTPNFGALVRFRLPMIPFMMFYLVGKSIRLKKSI